MVYRGAEATAGDETDKGSKTGKKKKPILGLVSKATAVNNRADTLQDGWEACGMAVIRLGPYGLPLFGGCSWLHSPWGPQRIP